MKERKDEIQLGGPRELVFLKEVVLGSHAPLFRGSENKELQKEVQVHNKKHVQRT